MPFNQSAAPRGSETILLLESDPETRKLAAFMLGKQGYSVLEARNRTEAFALFNQRAGDVELLLLEARRGSCQLAEEVKQYQPHVRVLFMCSDPARGVPFAGPASRRGHPVSEVHRRQCHPGGGVRRI